MVMKKLFERNKELEEQYANNRLEQTPEFTHTKANQIQSSEKSKQGELSSDLFDVTSEKCTHCIQLRKEMIQKEREMMDKINDLQMQLLKKDDGMT